MPEEDGTLDALCQEMTGIDVSFDKVRARFLRHYKITPTMDLGALVGRMGEIHTLMRAEALASRHPQTVQIYQLRRTTSRGRYSYHPSPQGTPNIIIRTPGRERPINELDLVLLVYGNPVIIETSLSRYAGCREGYIAKSLRPENVAMKKRHVLRLFHRQPKMVYVVPQEYVCKQETPESRMAAFVQQGNHIVPFPINRPRWRAEVEYLLFNLVG